MAITKEQILERLDDPEGLEELFQGYPEEFKAAIQLAYPIQPDSLVLRVWKARLDRQLAADQPAESAAEVPSSHPDSIDRIAAPASLLVVLLCAIAGSLAKIPQWFPSLSSPEFYARNAALCVLPLISVYFWLAQNQGRKVAKVLLLAFGIAATWINLVPELTRSDSLTLAAIHLPIFLGLLTGLAFCGLSRELTRRTDFLRCCGETAIYTGLILLTGILMTLLTMGLFQIIGLDIHEWYLNNVVTFGIASAPIVGTHLAFTRTRAGVAIAPLIAKIFSPLAMITLAVYLVAMMIQHKNPFSDRDFLIVFNLMLVSVLAIAIFCICERTENFWMDGVIFALILMAICVDFVALAAILYRLKSFGFSPNRVATLGANLLIFVNLGLIASGYPRLFSGKTGILPIRNQIARFLPVYGIWAALVSFGFPLIFRFK